jgi:hypothetical protein
LRGLLGRLFDRSASRRAPGREIEPYLLEPPELPLPGAFPVWRKSLPASPRTVEARRERTASRLLASELDLLYRKSLKRSPAQGMLGETPVESAPESPDLKAWTASGGVLQTALVGRGLLWLSGEGKIYLHEPQGKTYEISPGGNARVDRFVVDRDGENLFVLSGGMLQHWNLKNDWVNGFCADFLKGSGAGAMDVLLKDSPPGVQVEVPGGRLLWSGYAITRTEEGPERTTREGLRSLGRGFFVEAAPGGAARVWRKTLPEGPEEALREKFELRELGALPMEVLALEAGGREGFVFAAVPEGLLEWDTRTLAYRVFKIPGLREASAGGPVELHVSPDDSAALLSAGGRMFLADLAGARARLGSSSSALLQWSQTHPMFVEGNSLRIGNFSFPIAPPEIPGAGLGIGEREWKALNLPTNKKLIYNTLKAFALKQHALFIGETGGGKTWLAERIAQLTGNKLWMASLNEFTRPKDLIARDTFGEDGHARTSLSLSTVLQWMTRRGVLLLDELHKPLEGVSVVNNILQNGIYRLIDGRVFRQDKENSWVIGTMNPARPPYNGEAPSGELSSRFGATLEVGYLPPVEEEALLRIFFERVPAGLIEALVAAANDLRSLYPAILPLPVSSRTLMNVVEHLQRYPEDPPAEVFRKAFNPSSIVEDPMIGKIVSEVLRLRGVSDYGKPRVPSARAGAAEIERLGLAGARPAAPGREFPDWADIPMPMTSPASGEAQAPEPDPRAQPRTRLLETVSRILSGLTGLKLVPFHLLPGEKEEGTPRRWRSVLGLGEVQYLPEDLAGGDEESAYGRALHEVWHLVYSRPEILFDWPELVKNMAFQALWWAVEDPRVNEQGLRSLPGARDWLDAAYGEDFRVRDLALERAAWNESVPLHLQFNYALIYRWWRGRPDPRVTNPKVIEALREASGPVRKAISEPDAAKAFDIVREDVWPIYRRLMEDSLKNEMGRQSGEGGGQGEQGGPGGEGSSSGGGGQNDGSEPGPEKKDQDAGSGSSDQEGREGKEGRPSQGGQSSDAQGSRKRPLSSEELRQLAEQIRKELSAKDKDFRDRHSGKMERDPEQTPEPQRAQERSRMEERRGKMNDGGKKGQAPGPREDAGEQGGGDSDKGDGAADPKDGFFGKKSVVNNDKPKDSGPADLNPVKIQPSADRSPLDQAGRMRTPDEPLRTPNSMDRAGYKTFLDRVRQFVSIARAQLKAALKVRKRQRTIMDRDSGDLDPDSLYRIPMGRRDIFSDELIPDKVLYRVSLIIDTSGSMSSEKKERAIEGAILLVESLEKTKGIEFEIVRFDSEPIVLKPYRMRLNKDVKASVVASLMRTGNATQTHKALEDAIERIRLGRGERLIILVNDGDPDKNFDREKFKALVLSAKDIDIYGIGLGPDAGLVLELFPPGHGWWLRDAGEFAKSLVKILKHKIMGTGAPQAAR